jgi:hypothetical protein
MKEISKDNPLETKKHYEYLKALQVLNTEKPNLAKDLLASAQKVDVSQLGAFYASTGSFGSEDSDDIDQTTNLSNTILNSRKYPGAVNLQIPDTKDPSKRTSFYVPGALARTTYPEPTMAGEFGLDEIFAV